MMQEKPKQILDLEMYWVVVINNYKVNDEGEISLIDLSGLKRIMNLDPLKNFSQLEHLILDGNRISNLKPIAELNKLISISLYDNFVTDISPLSGLRSLQRINLSKNKIEDFSPLSKILQLKDINLSNNNIKNIDFIKNLKKITYANLSSNNIEDLSPIENLHRIKRLNLSKNEIIDLSYIKDLTQLIELNLQGNKISNLQPIESLNKLKYLDLKDNKISSLEPIANLTEIKYLNLQNNQISDISPLKWLINNGISISLSEVFSKKNYYKQKNKRGNINIFRNPIITPHISIIKNGDQAILNWLNNYSKEKDKGVFALNEAKMVIIGEPGAGKTTLMNYLLDRPFRDTTSTKGVKIEQWRIDDENEGAYRINIWDFGGDEIQSTVHRFFLTQDTLYIVLLNARVEEKPDKYLEQIRSYAPNSPILIVINQIDQKQWGTDEARLLEEYRTTSDDPMIKGFYKTSLRKVHEFNNPYFLPAVQSLEQSIKHEVLQMPTIRQTVPSNYLEVKSYLESRFFKDEPYITHERYEAICREKNLELASDEPLLKILDTLGTVRYFDETHTRHLHILNPEWLSDGVYRILTSEYTHQRIGVISEKDFSRILYKTDAHTFSYPKQHYGYLIEMIRRFYLGYVNPDTHEIFIPQAFKSDYPAGFRPEDFKTEALHFFFRYETFIPAGAISSFIARTFGRVRGHLYWQKGIVIEQRELEEVQTALVMQTDTKNRIDIWVQGTHRREFFIEIRKIFREFHERYPGLKVDEMIGLDAKRDTAVKYRVLIAHKHKGKTEYTDEEGNDYNIDRLLGMFESPAATQQAIVQNFQGSYYDMRGVKQVQFIQVEAQSIAEELTKFQQSAGEQNQAILNQLIKDLKELQKAESPKKAKGVLTQLKETVKNLPKIASEEAVKWATKTTLDGVSFSEKFDSLKERLLNLLQQEGFQDWIKPDNWG